MFSTIAGFVGKLFGSDTATTAFLDHVSSGVDKLYYSAEEKADDKAAAAKEANTAYIEWLKATSGSNLARRFIAVVVTLIWSSQYAFSMICSCIAPWVDVDTARALMETAATLQANGDQGNAAFMAVLGFYMLGSHAAPMFEAATKMFTKEKTAAPIITMNKEK